MIHSNNKNNRKSSLVAGLILALFLAVLGGHVLARDFPESPRIPQVGESEDSTFDVSKNPTASVTDFGIVDKDSTGQEDVVEEIFLEYDDNVDNLVEEDDIFSFLRGSDDQQQHSKQGRRRQQTTDTTRVNIFQKLGQSLGTTIVGCLLIAFMPCLIWKNEGRHVDELSRIDFCKNNAVAVDWYVAHSSISRWCRSTFQSPANFLNISFLLSLFLAIPRPTRMLGDLFTSLELSQ